MLARFDVFVACLLHVFAQFLQAGVVNGCSAKSGVGAVSIVVNLEFVRLGHTSMKILCQLMERTSRCVILNWTTLDMLKRCLVAFQPGKFNKLASIYRYTR